MPSPVSSEVQRKKSLTIHELQHGGSVNGAFVDALTLLFNGLQDGFGQIESETRLSCLADMIGSQRKPNERINELVSRFEIVWLKAQSEAAWPTPTESVITFLLKAVGVNQHQLVDPLGPTNGIFPQTRQELQALIGWL